jgi:hypothetical protein
VPALAEGEVKTLGGDVVPSVHPYDLVLTRLHARYAKDSLGEDIVFRPAPPIGGGREFVVAAGGLEKGSKASSSNNFQARYAIRHPWTGPVSCSEPHFGNWGGPPGSNSWNTPPPPTRAASKVAFAPRGAVKLASVLREDVPDLGMTAPQKAESPVRRASESLALNPGAILGVMGILAVTGLLLSQRRRHV